MPQDNTTSIQTLIVQDKAKRGDGAFGFSAMFRSGAYVPDDREMVAAKFEALGTEIERLRTCLGFFASVIKSGESWTPTCEAEYRKAVNNEH